MELKIASDKIFWQGKYRGGTLIKSRHETEFIPEVYEGEELSGWVCPGLVNAHCHLELSHLGCISKEIQGKGMAFFIQWIQEKRKRFVDIQKESIIKVLNDFKNEGVFFIGDICNSLITKKIKEDFTDIYFKNFWEVFGLNPHLPDEKWNEIQNNAKLMNASISLHAPYSCSSGLIEKVNATFPVIQSIHIAESREEVDYFEQNESKMKQAFLAMGIPETYLKDKLPFPEAILHKNTLQYLLVHNVYLRDNHIPQDILNKCFFCICPTSNLFLHGKTVSEEFIRNHLSKICLGTDSSATNDLLSVLKEMNYLKSMGLQNNEIVEMATSCGYKALLVPENYLQKYYHIVVIKDLGYNFETLVLWG